MAYSKLVVDLFQNPKNVGSLDETSSDVGTGVVGSPACGDVLQLQIQVDKETNTITNAKFKTFGCGAAIASSSYLTDMVIGKTLDEVLEIKNGDISEELELPQIKYHCSVLAENAIRSAIQDYKNKNSL